MATIKSNISVRNRPQTDDCLSIRERLVRKLEVENRFWSYAGESVSCISDDNLIVMTLKYLDVEDIDSLFILFPRKKVKKEWRDRMIPEGDYLRTLNRFIAWYYFGVKYPDRYLKAMETRNLNRLLS